MTRHHLPTRAAIAACSTLLCPVTSAFATDAHHEDAVSVIAFGSCARQNEPQPIWDVVVEQDPELFLFIGDNVYADLHRIIPTEPGQIQRAWDDLDAIPGWQRLSGSCRVLATWDDHDYGKNDAGKEWELKEASQGLFLDFFGVPEDSPRREREGVYSAETFGPEGRRVQVILLDTRYHRDELDRADPRQPGRGPYRPSTGGRGTFLGEAQWAWFEEQLREPADVRIIGSSIQVVPYESMWEVWNNFPHERQRLFDAIDEADASGVVFISGDRHLTEISVEEDSGPYPMWDFTSSGMNESEREVNEPNRYRVGPVKRMTTFGMIRIAWDAPRPYIDLEALGDDGEVLFAQRVRLSDLAE
ncbi:MAG: alkaline phosphatase D family protein [Planctomycetota bacterium]